MNPKPYFILRALPLASLVTAMSCANETVPSGAVDAGTAGESPVPNDAGFLPPIRRTLDAAASGWWTRFADSGQIEGRIAADGAADVDGSDCVDPVTAPPSTADLDPIEGKGPDWSWWVVTSAGRSDASTPTFVPAASPPAPTPTTAADRTFLQLSGYGLGVVDYGLLGFSPSPSVAGGEPTDLSGAPGLTFDAKGHDAWVIVNTADVVPRFCKCKGADCFVGYRYKLPITDGWASYSLTWEQLELPPYVVSRPAFDPKTVTTISFGKAGSGDFDVSIDNLRLTRAVELDAGEAGP